jgi:hypothetical protein
MLSLVMRKLSSRLLKHYWPNRIDHNIPNARLMAQSAIVANMIPPAISNMLVLYTKEQ